MAGGLTFLDCAPITADGVDELVECSRTLADMQGPPAYMAAGLRNASLYAFALA